MTVADSILSRIQQAMSFFVRSLEPPVGLYLRHSIARPKILHRQVPIFRLVPLSLACGVFNAGLIVNEPQRGNIDKQIEST